MVATCDLGKLGPSQTKTVSIEWQWYYPLPGLAIWLFIAPLLILVRDNRNSEAWTILIPAIPLTVVVWPSINRWTPRLFYSLCCFAPDFQADVAFNALVGGWTALWLMAPWLARRRAAWAFSIALAFLMVSGILIHATAFIGARSYCSSTLFWCRSLLYPVLWYSTCALAMLLGMTLAATRCRRAWNPRRFLAWLAVGTLAGTGVGTAIFLSVNLPADVSSIPVWYLVLRPIACISGVAAFTYLLNLPFLYLAHRCPCYRNRLYGVLRLPTGVTNGRSLG